MKALGIFVLILVLGLPAFSQDPPQQETVESLKKQVAELKSECAILREALATANADIDQLRRTVAARIPTARNFWDVAIVGKSAADASALQMKINIVSQRIRSLGPTETPPVFFTDRNLSPSEEDVITAVNTRNAQRQEAQRDLDELQKEYARMNNTRLISGTLDDGTAVSILANGPACVFADAIQPGKKYRIHGSALTMNGVLRITMQSAMIIQPPSGNFSTEVGAKTEKKP